jgi:hypothetical protein
MTGTAAKVRGWALLLAGTVLGVAALAVVLVAVWQLALWLGAWLFFRL